MSEFPLPNPVENAAGLPKFSQSKVESIFKESDTPVTPYEFIWRICEIEDVGLNALSVLSIDHSVPPVQHTKGGSVAAMSRWNEFMEERLGEYSENRTSLN